jgi:hypothetical protein
MAAGADPAILHEVGAGAEEESVPTRVDPVPEGDAVELAYAAAGLSTLRTGIGIGGDGAVAVHHATLPPDAPVGHVGPEAPAADRRTIGHLAARIVKVLPLA